MSRPLLFEVENMYLDRKKTWQSYLKSVSRKHRGRRSGKRRREQIMSECLEPRHLLTGVALTTSSDNYTISFDETQSVTIEEFRNSDDHRQLSFRVDGVGSRQVDFDDDQPGVQSIILTAS